MKCPKCNYENKPDALACGMCGEILKPKQPEPANAPAETAGNGKPTRACKNHPDRQIESFCSTCYKEFCSECITETNGKKICLDCLSKSLNTGSQYSENDSMDILKLLWRVIGVILVINYVIPLMSMMGTTVMTWTCFQMSFMAGFALLLPTLCGILLIVLTIAGGDSKIRGLIVAVAGLLALGFFYLGSSNPFGSGMESTSKFNSFLTFISFLSFALMLTGSKLKREHEESKTASLLGGVSGVIFLIATLIIIIQIIASSGFSLASQIPMPSSGYGFLMTVTWIILILCSIGCIVSGVLAVINLFNLPTKSTIAHYSFKLGFLSTLISVGWILILIVIMALSISSYGMSGGIWWMVLFMYRTIFVLVALLLMLATGTYDWMKRANIVH
jgi:hypothetical protein